MSEADPTTEELRIAQAEREQEERERAEHGVTEEDADQHERRADKASYLREKLEERARAEREAAREDWESELSASDLPGAADADAAAPGGTGESEDDHGDDDAERKNPDTQPDGPA